MSEVRIVSLVPSITELVCDLGLAGSLVGRTGFCIHPWETVRHIRKVGGTKDVLMDRVRELRPTHAIVNVDENPREVFEELRSFVPTVIVTHPLGPLDNFGLYRQLGDAFGCSERAEQLCASLEDELARLRTREFERQDVLYLIWREPWMTVSADTYISRMLALIGWQTVPRPGGAAVEGEPYGADEAPAAGEPYGADEATATGEPYGADEAAAAGEPYGPDEATAWAGAAGESGADRYPKVALSDYADRVDRVLLSSEPYHFKVSHLDEVRALVPGAEVSLIDGEMTSWYGSRAIRGLRYLRTLQ